MSEHIVIIPATFSRLYMLPECVRDLGQLRTIIVSDCDYDTIGDEFRRMGVSKRTHYDELVKLEQPKDKPFNKGRFLNAGIEAALKHNPASITLLDADSIPGAHFADGIINEDWSNINRRCYRVRYVPNDYQLEDCTAPETYPVAYEAYGNPGTPYANKTLEVRTPPPNAIPWGNSQMTLRSDIIQKPRFDEAMAGHGFEDLDFMWNLRDHLNPQEEKQVTMVTEPDYAIYHRRHGYEPNWKPEVNVYAKANRSLFLKKVYRP